MFRILAARFYCSALDWRLYWGLDGGCFPWSSSLSEGQCWNPCQLVRFATKQWRSPLVFRRTPVVLIFFQGFEKGEQPGVLGSAAPRRCGGDSSDVGQSSESRKCGVSTRRR